MRLASEGATGGVERRRVSLAELETDRNEELARAVALLTDRRLLTASAGTIELAHEALLREWPRLRDWIEADRAGLRLHRNLTAAAREWQGVNRDEESLLRGTRLTETLEWARDNPQSLNEAEREFLSASEARQQLEQTERRRRTRFAIGGLSAAVVLVSAVALIALLQSWEASRQRDIAASRGLAASASEMLDVDPALSLELALLALERRDTTQAENVLRQATYATRGIDVWPTHRGVVRALSVSKDGLTVATGGDDGTIAIRRMDSGRLLTRIKSSNAAVIGVALSPDGRRVASTRDNGSVTISAIDGREPRTVLRLGHETTPHYGPNYGLAVSFSNDGRQIVVGALDGSVRVLRADGVGAPRVLRGHEALVLDVGFSPGGTRVVSSDYHLSARAWDLRRGTSVRLEHKDVERSSFSPAGDRIATAGLDGIVRLWRPDGSGPTRRIRIGVPLLSVRFSRTGRRLVTAGQDGVVRISDVRGGPLLDALRRHRGEATGAAFVARGQVVSTGEDGTLRRWDPLDPAILHGSFVSASFSPDGSRVLTGGEDGRVRLFDPKTGDGVPVNGHERGCDRRALLRRRQADRRSPRWTARCGSRTPRSGRARRRQSRSARRPETAADLDPSGKRNRQRRVQHGRRRPGRRAGGRQARRTEGPSRRPDRRRFSRDGRRVAERVGGRYRADLGRRDGKVRRRCRVMGRAWAAGAVQRDGTRIVTAGADGSGSGLAGLAVSRRPVILRGHEGGVNARRSGPRRHTSRQRRPRRDGSRLGRADGGETLVVAVQAPRGALGASFSPDGQAGRELRRERCRPRLSMRGMRLAGRGSADLRRTRADRALSQDRARALLPAPLSAPSTAGVSPFASAARGYAASCGAHPCPHRRAR